RSGCSRPRPGRSPNPASGSNDRRLRRGPWLISLTRQRRRGLRERKRDAWMNLRKIKGFAALPADFWGRRPRRHAPVMDYVRRAPDWFKARRTKCRLQPYRLTIAWIVSQWRTRLGCADTKSFRGVGIGKKWMLATKP